MAFVPCSPLVRVFAPNAAHIYFKSEQHLSGYLPLSLSLHLPLYFLLPYCQPCASLLNYLPPFSPRSPLNLVPSHAIYLSVTSPLWFPPRLPPKRSTFNVAHARCFPSPPLISAGHLRHPGSFILHRHLTRYLGALHGATLAGTVCVCGSLYVISHVMLPSLLFRTVILPDSPSCSPPFLRCGASPLSVVLQLRRICARVSCRGFSYIYNK